MSSVYTVRALLAGKKFPGAKDGRDDKKHKGKFSAQVSSEGSLCKVEVSVTSEEQYRGAGTLKTAQVLDVYHTNCEASGSGLFPTGLEWRITDYRSTDFSEATEPYYLRVCVDRCDVPCVSRLSIHGYCSGLLGYTEPGGKGDIPSDNKSVFPWGEAGEFKMDTRLAVPGEAIYSVFDLADQKLSFVSALAYYKTGQFSGGIVTGKTGVGTGARINVWSEGKHISVQPTDFYAYREGEWVYLLSTDTDPEIFNSGSNASFNPVNSGWPSFQPPKTLPTPEECDTYRALPIRIGGIGIRKGQLPSFDVLLEDYYPYLVQTKLYVGKVVEVDYQAGTVDVTIEKAGTYTGLEVYYHATASGALKEGIKAFDKDDEVLVLQYEGKKKVVGFVDKLKYPGAGFILELEFAGGDIYYWDVINDCRSEVYIENELYAQPFTRKWVDDHLVGGNLYKEPTRYNTSVMLSVGVCVGEDDTPTPIVTGVHRYSGGWNCTYGITGDKVHHKTTSPVNQSVSCLLSPWTVNGALFRSVHENPPYTDISAMFRIDYHNPSSMSDLFSMYERERAQTMVFPWDDGPKHPVGAWDSVMRVDNGYSTCGYSYYYGVLYIPCYWSSDWTFVKNSKVLGTDLYSTIFVRYRMLSYVYQSYWSGRRSIAYRLPFQTTHESVEGHMGLCEPYVKDMSFRNDEWEFPCKGVLIVVPQFLATEVSPYDLFNAVLGEAGGAETSTLLIGEYIEYPPWTGTTDNEPAGYTRKWRMSMVGNSANPRLLNSAGTITGYKVIQGFASKAVYQKEGLPEYEKDKRYNDIDYRLDCPRLREWLEKEYNRRYKSVSCNRVPKLKIRVYSGSGSDIEWKNVDKAEE